MLLSFIRYLQYLRESSRTRYELSRLDDRQLSDIGISRSDIPRIAAETSARF